MRFVDHFSQLAQYYSRYRPHYPAALFEYLATISPGRNLAWDCGTGNGQAALQLVKRFDRVVATDASSEQIAQAFPHGRIAYRVERAEEVTLASRSVDLVTVAVAVHWFDLDAFYKEVRRVLKPGGVLAVWTYHLPLIEAAIDGLLGFYYREVLGVYWPERFHYVDQKYKTLPFPFEEIETPEFVMHAEWGLNELVGFLSSWSATRKYSDEKGSHPLAEIWPALKEVWGDTNLKREIQWPLYIRIGRVATSTLFRSFWLGGFESACQKLCTGERIDMIAATQHDRQVAEDYRRLRSQGIQTARDGVRWHLIDRGGDFDFSSLTAMLEASQSADIQLIWSLCHYGWPDDLDVFDASFIERYARYCGGVARFIADHSDDIPFYSPFNEISFLAWAAAEVGFIYPCQRGRANELKRQLVRATIAGCEAIWNVDSRARIVHVDPVIQVVAPPGRPDLSRHALIQQSAQFEAWDMLGGWEQPELGGQPRYLDIIGVNYYHDNQWELERDRLSWEDRLASGDNRWLRLHSLLETVYTRYLRPIFIAETSHFGVGRGPWIRMIAKEVCQARAIGVPVEGICVYPVIDRPDWHDRNHWHKSGLWDLEQTDQGELIRLLNQPYAEDLRQAQTLLANCKG